MRKKVLVFDTETGGLDAATDSILTIGAVVWCDGAIEGTFSAVVDEGELHITDGARAVHKLTDEYIKQEGKAPQIVVEQLLSFLQRHDLWFPKGRKRVILGGHNVPFDIAFLKRLFSFSTHDYDKVFSYRPIDTQVVAHFLTLAGKLDVVSTSLNQLCNHYKIIIREGGAAGAHDALEDATATARLLTALVGAVKKEEACPTPQLVS